MAAIENMLYTAAADGTKADVTEQRNAAAGLAQQLNDLTVAERALADRVQNTEQAHATLIAEEFISLSGTLAARVDEFQIEYAAFQEEFEAAHQQFRDRERALRDECTELLIALPAPIRNHVRVTPTLELHRPVGQWADPGLSHFVADGSWPDWCRGILSQSRELRERAQERLGAGMRGSR